MKPANRCDYLIVGGGLAATTLTWQLLERKKKICLVHSDVHPAASEIAAGMYNPLVFKRITKSWMADDLLPYMEDFYRSIESRLKINLLHPMPIAKLLVSEEIERWHKKRISGKLENYIADIRQGTPFPALKEFAGHAIVTGGGYLDIPAFLKGSFAYFKNRLHLVNEGIKHNEIQINRESVTWKGIEADKLVFCEGASATKNPFFKHVVYYLTRGDVLSVFIPEFQQHTIINKNLFVLPRGENRYKVGSTYDHHDLSLQPSKKALEYLKEGLEKIINTDFKVLAHHTGIRPTIRDRRPVLGLHPQHRFLGYFNGLGTKGVMLAPFFANQMMHLLEDDEPVHVETRIERFQPGNQTPSG